jgi:hypothetical protein
MPRTRYICFCIGRGCSKIPGAVVVSPCHRLGMIAGMTLSVAPPYLIDINVYNEQFMVES